MFIGVRVKLDQFVEIIFPVNHMEHKVLSTAHMFFSSIYFLQFVEYSSQKFLNL